MTGAAPHFPVRTAVRVHNLDPPGHVRTPSYVRGKVGWIARYQGTFENPEELAYLKDPVSKRELYLVGFDLNELWSSQQHGADRLFVDVYEHWLDPIVD